MFYKSLEACDFGTTRSKNRDENVILYQENSNQTYEDHFLNEKDIKANGGLNNFSMYSIMNSIKNFYKSIKNFFVKKSKRLFIKMHQFVGCSHLMSVKYFMSSIKNCSFVAHNCRTQHDFNANVSKCHLNSKDEIKAPPRMGFYADMSAQSFKTSYGNFFLNTTGTQPFCIISSANTTTAKSFLAKIFSRGQTFM